MEGLDKNDFETKPKNKYITWIIKKTRYLKIPFFFIDL